MEANKETGVFVNGKAQIIEMLQIMPADEREVLLKNIKIKNPQLASELVEKSLNFSYIFTLDDHGVTALLNYIKPEILGVALKSVGQKFQRQLLSMAPRAYAEKAYQVMAAPMSNEAATAKKAQNKIVGVLVSLSKRGQIRL